MKNKKDRKIERKLKNYLKSKPVPVPSDEAQEMLEHAAKCKKCSEMLFKHGEHAGALLELTHSDWTPSEAVAEIMAKSQQELLTAAKNLLKYLSLDVHEHFSDEVLPEMSNRFAEACAKDDNLTPELIRIAVSISEVSLALETLMSSRRKLDDVIVFKLGDNEFLLPNRKVSLNYLFNRISEESGITREVAVDFWNALLNLLKEDPHALPDIISEVSNDQIIFKRKPN